MTENNKNILKIDEVLDELYYLREENEKLKANNKIMADELTYFKEHCADLEDEVNRLKNRCRELTVENHDLLYENNDMKFTRNYLTSEDAGKAFAQELLGHRMTPEEVAIDAAENGYKPYVGDDF